MTSRTQPLALVLDDAPDMRLILSRLAAAHGFEVIDAADGLSGLRLAKEHRPDLILLDLEMPGMSGLQLLSEVRQFDASVAVVIVSSHADEARMNEALALGAVNYVKKPFNQPELAFVLDQIHRVTEEAADARILLELVEGRETRISMGSESALISKIVAFLGRELVNHYPGFVLPLTEIKLGLSEALSNAQEHGNLEITSEEKSEALESSEGIFGLINQRLADPRLAARKIHLAAEYGSTRVRYRIRDEGRGFDPEVVVQRGVADTSALHGRGITLIRHYMDEVSWNETGNEIRLVALVRPRERIMPTYA